MATDEEIPGPEEQLPASSVCPAANDLGPDYPPRPDAERLVRSAPRRPRRWLAIVVAASLTLVLVVAAGFTIGPWRGAGANPSGSAHFDNGEFAFDYPASWRVILGKFEAPDIRIDTVVGTGDWRNGCSTGNCFPDTVDVSGGRIVVKVWRRTDGPGQTCNGGSQANATLGPNAVQKSVQGSATTWEIRRPVEHEFGWTYNVFIEATTDSPAQLSAAEALVASFRWLGPAPAIEPLCSATSQP